MNQEILYQRAYLRIKKAKKILIVSHINPDGDALSSVGAFLELATLLGVSAQAFCSKKKGRTFDYLPHEDLIMDKKELLDPLESFDVIVILDCGSLGRTDLALEIKELLLKKERPFLIEVDHHPKMDNYADLEIRQIDKSATAEIIYSLLKENKVSFNKNLANCILTGIITDTGNFLYPSASGENLDIAAQMLSCGAQFPKIIHKTVYNKSVLTMKLWGLAMERLEINQRYNIAYSIITQQDIDNLAEQFSLEEIKDCLDKDVFGDIVGFLSNLSHVKALMLIREDEGRIKGSLRTASGNIDVSELAKYLGGGGHYRASGFSLAAQITQAEGRWLIK